MLAKAIRRDVAFAAAIRDLPFTVYRGARSGKAALADFITREFIAAVAADPKLQAIVADNLAHAEHRFLYGTCTPCPCAECGRLRSASGVPVLAAGDRADAEGGGNTGVIPQHGRVLRGKSAARFWIDDIEAIAPAAPPLRVTSATTRPRSIAFPSASS